MRKIGFLAFVLLLPLALIAQPAVAPGIFTTLKTTSTAATSLQVGCTVGSSTCTGGIKSGPISGSTGTFSGEVTVTGGSSGVGTLRFGSNTLIYQGGTSGHQWNSSAAASLMTMSDAGVLANTGFGAHTFIGSGSGANSLRVTNSSAGSGNRSEAVVTNNSGSGAYLQMFASNYASSGSAVADGARIYTDGVGGFIIDSTSGLITFYGNSAQRFKINASGDWLVGASGKIMDSTGTPTLSSCANCGASPTIAGSDYAFIVTMGAGSTTGANPQITFGHTWSTTPVCVVSPSTAAATAGGGATSTSAAGFTIAGSTVASLTMLCRGY